MRSRFGLVGALALCVAIDGVILAGTYALGRAQGAAAARAAVFMALAAGAGGSVGCPR